MSIQSLEKEYQERIDSYNSTTNALHAKYNTYSFVRLIIFIIFLVLASILGVCLLYTSPSPRDATLSRMPSSA